MKSKTNDLDVALEALRQIKPSLLDYDQWVKVGMALKDAGASFDAWDTWSQRDSERYDQKVMKPKWDSFNGGGVGIGTLIRFCREQGGQVDTGKVKRPASTPARKKATTAPATAGTAATAAPATPPGVISNPAGGLLPVGLNVLPPGGIEPKQPGTMDYQNITVYLYRNAAGELVKAQVRIPITYTDAERARAEKEKCNLNSKTFRQFYAACPDADTAPLTWEGMHNRRCWADKAERLHPGDFAFDLGYGKGRRPDPLYRENDLAAMAPDAVLYCVEGEKDADNLAALGYCCTCHKTSKSAITDPKRWEPFTAGRKVIIIQDNDRDGENYAIDAAVAIRKTGATVYIVFSPGAEPKGDFTDWLEAQRKEVPEPSTECIKERFDAWTDTNNLEEFIKDRRAITSKSNGAKGGRTWLPVDEWAASFIHNHFKQEDKITLRCMAGQWFLFQGSYWQKYMKGDLESRIMGYLQENHSLECRVSATIRSDVLENIKSDKLCGLDSSKYKIPCFLPSGESAMNWIPMKNAVINVEEAAEAVANGNPLPTNSLKELSPDIFFTYGLGYDFDQTATCPKWEKYLADVQPDIENREILQMMVGLGLVPDCSYNVAFFLLGEAGTGKSTFINILSRLIGRDNYCTIPLSRLADRFGLAPLTQKLLNLVGDMPTMPENGKSAGIEAMFKSVTAGDDLPVEIKYQDGYTAKAIARMIFATNHMPDFVDRSAAVWDRIRIVPFNQRIRNTTAQNPHLSTELCEELPGIFNWALRGLAMLRKRKTFPEATEGEKIKDELRNQCDHERAFLSEKTEAYPGGFEVKDKLYAEYREWIQANGYRALGKSKFDQRVTAIYPSVTESRHRTENGQVRCFSGIRLKSWF